MVDDSAAQLVARARAATDANGYFAAMYATVTGRITDAIASGSVRCSV